MFWGHKRGARASRLSGRHGQGWAGGVEFGRGSTVWLQVNWHGCRAHLQSKSPPGTHLRLHVAVHGARVELGQVCVQDGQALEGVVVAVEPEAAVGGVVVARVEVLGPEGREGGEGAEGGESKWASGWRRGVGWA